MKVSITKDMVDQAFLNVNSKLAEGNQVERVFGPNTSSQTYYVNNVAGELGELAFQKAVLLSGHTLGVDAHTFEPFMNSDVCDFYTSKTAKTIDVKTVYRKNAGNLLITKNAAHWKPIYAYVLVELLPSRNGSHTIKSLYEINSANIVGSRTFGAIPSSPNVQEREMYGKQVYLVPRSELTPIAELISNHFFSHNERVPKYKSKGALEIQLASVENGSLVDLFRNLDVDEISRDYNSRGRPKGRYNFIPAFLRDSNKMVSFSMYEDKFYTSLFVKALLEAEVRARELKLTLVIPDYIEDYIPKKDIGRVVDIIKGFKCETEFNWKEDKYY